MKKIQDYVVRRIQKEYFQDPKLIAIGWTQYTPHFNDGDECNFNVYDLYELTTDNQDENANLQSDVYNWGEGYSGYCTKELAEFDSLIQSDEYKEMMKLVFGDHVQIKITKSGYTVEEYDHE